MRKKPRRGTKNSAQCQQKGEERALIKLKNYCSIEMEVCCLKFTLGGEGRQAIVAPGNLTASTFSNQRFNVKGSSGWGLWALLIEVGALS